MKYMPKLLLVGMIAAPQLLPFGGDSIQKEAAALLARAPKDYITLDRTDLPLRDVLAQVAALMMPVDEVPQLRELLRLIEQGRKAVAKKLLKDALVEAAHLFAERQGGMNDGEKRTLLAQQLQECLKFFADEQPVQSVNEIGSFCAACVASGPGVIAVSSAS